MISVSKLVVWWHLPFHCLIGSVFYIIDINHRIKHHQFGMLIVFELNKWLWHYIGGKEKKIFIIWFGLIWCNMNWTIRMATSPTKLSERSESFLSCQFSIVCVCAHWMWCCWNNARSFNIELNGKWKERFVFLDHGNCRIGKCNSSLTANIAVRRRRRTKKERLVANTHTHTHTHTHNNTNFAIMNKWNNVKRQSKSVN